MKRSSLSRWLVVLLSSLLLVGACALDEDSESSADQQQNEETTDNDDPGDDNESGNSNGDSDNQADDGDEDDNDGEDDNEQTDQNPDLDERVQHLVAADDYREMVVEVDYVEGKQTRDGIDDRLVDSLGDVVDKPEGIEVDFRDEITETAPPEGWSLDELSSLLDDYGSVEDDDVIEVHTLLVDGEYAESENVLGIAWANRNVVMFMDRIEEACHNASLLGLDREQLCEHAELTVWRHEMGHVLGLVDNGAPMQSDHADEQHSSHCAHEECVMYWAYRSPDMMERLVDGLSSGDDSAPQFDGSCREDLEAIQ